MATVLATRYCLALLHQRMLPEASHWTLRHASATVAPTRVLEWAALLPFLRLEVEAWILAMR